MAAAFLLLPCGRAQAHMYGEHKTIGDEAFLRFARAHARQAFLAHADVQQDQDGRYYFPGLSAEGGHRISYGALNALGGDHERNPLELQQQLRHKSSKLQQIMALHDAYTSMGHVAAPDGKLARLDFDYALQAAVNLAHFYEYEHGFHEHLEPFDPSSVKACQAPALVAATFARLGGTNALNMYATVHLAAVDLAEQAGRLASTDPRAARTLVHYALLYNGFADHFLEDSFSAGHLVVKRRVRDSLTNNKALHDFYSVIGTTALNRRGELWHAYGDGQLNSRHDEWARQPSLLDVAHTPYDPEAERIIEAVRLSLNDLQDAFERSYADPAAPAFLERLPADAHQRATFLIETLDSLQLVPIPYESDLPAVFGTTPVSARMSQANQRLAYRDFVRSRIANSFVVGLNRSVRGRDYFRAFDFRINVGRLGTGYSHNSRGGKRGTWDRWHGYTLDYSVGHLDRAGEDVRASQLRAGVRTNLDRWVSDRKVLGLYSYLEAGVQFAEGKRELVFVPSLGVQLGSLLNLDYYKMPAWLRIPVQLLVPLKFRVGTVMASQRRPKWFSGIEMDFVF